MINRFLNGYTNLIFTYGITGSGKTHTISGQNMDGLMPKILEGIFTHPQMDPNNGSNLVVCASYLENYTNQVYDLLSDLPPISPTGKDSNGTNNLKSKENRGATNNMNGNKDKENMVTVRVVTSNNVDLENAKAIDIESAQEGLRLIDEGNKKRSKAHTKFNTVTLSSYLQYFVVF